MYRRLIWNDFLKSPTVSIITLLLITAAALLISSAVSLGAQLAGAMDLLMTQAKTPHFLQMHSGPLDRGRLESFARENQAVEEFQVLEFLNMEGADILIGTTSLAGSVQDNGLCTQSPSFDYLLDLNGTMIRPAQGELYLPVAYQKALGAEPGDQAIIAGREFTVAGFLRDSQMNSLLASSKRLLISAEDYEAIRDRGRVEHLIEFRLKELSALGPFEAAYIGAGLETNGPTVTYPLFRMMNALSDGLMLAVLLLISFLVSLIALLCIRFTLLAKIEEEGREIGVMKALGLRTRDLKKLYLGKYAAIAALGSILGWGGSLALEKAALAGIRLTLGSSGSGAFPRLLGLAAVLLVFLAVMAYVNRVLNRFRKISPVQAIRFGTLPEQAGHLNRLPLSRNKRIDINILLGIKAVLSRKRLYGTMLLVVTASTLMMLVPQNLYSTISAPGFSTYMGIGKCDLLIRIQQTDSPAAQAAAITQTLEGDREVAGYTLLTTKSFTLRQEEGKEEQLKVELGDHTRFPLLYLQGHAPQTEKDIALSALNAAELGKQVGDTLVLTGEGWERRLTVCGIYSDITNGGKTAKAAFSEEGGGTMWHTLYVEFSPHSSLPGKVRDYSAQFHLAKVADIDGYIAQTFGPTLHSVAKVSAAGFLGALLITLWVTLLMIKLLIARERPAIALMKALGFTGRDIILQFSARFLLVLLMGILLGMVLTYTLGEGLTGAVLASFGAPAFRFVTDPLFVYLLCPLAMACAVLSAVLPGTRGIRNIRVARYIKE